MLSNARTARRTEAGGRTVSVCLFGDDAIRHTPDGVDALLKAKLLIQFEQAFDTSSLRQPLREVAQLGLEVWEDLHVLSALNSGVACTAAWHAQRRGIATVFADW